MKYKVFENELNLIQDERLKENAKIILNNLPDYFYKIQAASTGKYHPKYALGDGGLVRHTKAAVRFAYELLNNNCIGNVFNDLEKVKSLEIDIPNVISLVNMLKVKYSKLNDYKIKSLDDFIKAYKDVISL